MTIISEDVNKHFLITQLQTILVGVLFTGLMQLSNHLSIIIVYYCPLLIIFMWMEYHLYWKRRPESSFLYNFLHMLMIFIFLPIFFGIYFGIFHETAKLTFEKVENCEMVGVFASNTHTVETYHIMYINFDYKGETYLGVGCSSKFYNSGTSQIILPYKNIYNGDFVVCNRETEEDEKNKASRRGCNNIVIKLMGNNLFILNKYKKQLVCFLEYEYSKVKLASWICEENNYNLEQYMNKQPCYVNFFGDSDTAKENGQERINMKETYNFPLISYKEHPYYPKSDIHCLIAFTFYQFILSFNWIFQYTSICLMKIRFGPSLVQVVDANKYHKQKQQQQESQNKELDYLNRVRNPQLNSNYSPNLNVNYTPTQDIFSKFNQENLDSYQLSNQNERKVDNKPSHFNQQKDSAQEENRFL